MQKATYPDTIEHYYRSAQGAGCLNSSYHGSKNMTKEQLAAQRQKEAITGAAVMGVPDTNMNFLRIDDMQLALTNETAGRLSSIDTLSGLHGCYS